MMRRAAAASLNGMMITSSSVLAVSPRELGTARGASSLPASDTRSVTLTLAWSLVP